MSDHEQKYYQILLSEDEYRRAVISVRSGKKSRWYDAKITAHTLKVVLEKAHLLVASSDCRLQSVLNDLESKTIADRALRQALLDSRGSK